MNNIQIYLRIKRKDELVQVTLSKSPYPQPGDRDFLWESSGEYFLEAFQCGSNPSICSIEMDPRILNKKEEIALMLMDAINASRKVKVG